MPNLGNFVQNFVQNFLFHYVEILPLKKMISQKFDILLFELLFLSTLIPDYSIHVQC
jgi:hypothetical protein